MPPLNSGPPGPGLGGPLETVRRGLDELSTGALTLAYGHPRGAEDHPGGGWGGESGAGPAGGDRAGSDLSRTDPSSGDAAEMLAALSRLAQQAFENGLAQAAELSRAWRENPPGGHEELLHAIGALDAALDTALDTILDTGAGAGADAGRFPAFAAIAADPELLSDFILESHDHLAAIETNLLAVEREPGNTEAIHAVFRAFHTIKGLAGFLELPAMQQAAHEIETLLDHARNGKIRLGPVLIDVILEGADYIRAEVARVADTLEGAAGAETAPNSPLIAKVRSAMAAALTAGGVPPSAAASAPVAPDAQASVPPASALRATEDTGAPAADEPGGESGRNRSGRLEPAGMETASPAENSGERRSGGDSGRLVKVATGKLDFLVDMIGELVIAQSLIHHDSVLNTVKHATLQRNLAQLGRITADVQKMAMSMRMVPVGQLFQKSARIIRDLTRRSGKLAELEMVGEETQLDRTIVEELADPLLHMIRNSADHGIETPAERTACGKPATARIGLKAYHRAGFIAIEVSDDGRGLSREKILAKARQRGLVAPGAELTEKEVFNLIFEPGFSTAEKVTDISGRGVGMDVVRKQVQKLRGRIEIESKAGRGTTFLLKLPLTLAIIDGLVVGVGEERFILPIYAVEEMFRPQADAIFTVENQREMVLIRGGLLPVVRLHQRFSIPARARELTEGVLVVAESGERKFCLAVDQLLGKQEVVIKNLGAMFQGIAGVAGGAILGDGRVGLILDMDGLLRESPATRKLA